MLTVAIITCNRIEQYKEAVKSCLNHIHGNWELVIVDNNSNDGTEVWTREFVQSIDNVTLNYRYLDKNYGVAGARNIAYRLAKGDIVYFLDDDAIIKGESDCLNKAYDYISENTQIALMGTEIYDHKVNQNLTEISKKNSELTTGTLMRSFVGASHFINKKLVGDITLYPEFIFYGGEELYLAFRSYDKWGTCVYYREFIVHHYPSSKTRLTEHEMKVSLYCNAYRVRQALLPTSCIIWAKLFFIINILRCFKFDFKSLKQCISRAKQVPLNTEKITMKTVRKLIRLFGLIKVFK